MKNNQLHNQWLLYGRGLDWQLGAVVVFWLLFEGVTAAALALTGERTTVILSGMICLILLAFVSIFTGFQRVNRALTLGIAMGATRRGQTTRCIAWHAGSALASVVLIFALDGVSHLIYRLAYAPRGIALEIDGLALLPAGVWGLILLVPVPLALCLAATVNRLGQKGYLVLWALWMVVCFSPSQLIRLYEDAPAVLWTIAVAALAALAVWTVWAVRRLLCWTVREL